MRKGSSTKIKGEDVGKGNGEMVGRRYHCFMEGLFDFVDATALWKDIRFTLERGIYAILSEGNNNNNNRRKGKVSAKKYGERGEALGYIWGVEGKYWNENVFAWPDGLREKLKLRFRVGDLDLPQRSKRYTSSREEDMDAHMCPCGTIESRTHIVGECEIYKEERDAVEEMRKLDECDMDEFDRLEGSEKTMTILGDRWWPQTAKQDGNRISKQFYVIYGKSVTSAQTLEVSLLGVGTVFRLERDAWSMAT